MEEIIIKSIITRDVYPILTKAFPVQLIEKKSRSLSDFINGLWKAQSAEAEMFIQAFGIATALAKRILTAWKGVASYASKYAAHLPHSDRQRIVSGRTVSVRIHLGGRSLHKK